MQNIVRNLRLTTMFVIVFSLAAVADERDIDESAEPVVKPATFDWSGLIQPPGTTASRLQRDSFTSYAEALANKTFSEAEIVAKQMVEQTNRESSADPIDKFRARAGALHNLAIAQQFMGSHESAKQNYTAAIEVITSADNNLSPDLIQPLRGLAYAYLDTGDTAEAYEIIDRALHVSNVNYGPHSLGQLPILNSKLQHFLQQDDVLSAVDMLDRIYMLYTRQYSRYQEELLPALYQRAEIYHELGFRGDARRAWQHILAVKKEALPENDLALIEPNVRIAESMMRSMRHDDFRSVTTSAAERHLKKALWIAENSPEQDWEVRKDCLLTLADFYTVFDMKGRARRHYASAWKLMSSNDESLALRAENLESPVPLARARPNPYADFEYNPNRDQIPASDYLEGEMTYAFTVNDRGRTENLRVLTAEPADFKPMERRVHNAVKEFVYRPRLVDGQPSSTADLQYKVKFYYLPSEYQAYRDKVTGRRSPWQSPKP
jgi:tetratricopeptide (TPR) repeat protein